MHREFDPTDRPFDARSDLSLYALTLLLVGLLTADLWPLLAGWLSGVGVELPTWTSREFYGYRFALIAAVIGGAKILYGSLDRLFTDGKVGADVAVAVASAAAIMLNEPLVAAEVVLIALLGECLEAFTFDRTQRELRKLTELFPHRCWVMRDGVETRIYTVELVVGDQRRGQAGRQDSCRWNCAGRTLRVGRCSAHGRERADRQRAGRCGLGWEHQSIRLIDD